MQSALNNMAKGINALTAKVKKIDGVKKDRNANVLLETRKPSTGKKTKNIFLCCAGTKGKREECYQAAAQVAENENIRMKQPGENSDSVRNINSGTQREDHQYEQNAPSKTAKFFNRLSRRLSQIQGQPTFIGVDFSEVGQRLSGVMKKHYRLAPPDWWNSQAHTDKNIPNAENAQANHRTNPAGFPQKANVKGFQYQQGQQTGGKPAPNITVVLKNGQTRATPRQIIDVTGVAEMSAKPRESRQQTGSVLPGGAGRLPHTSKSRETQEIEDRIKTLQASIREMEEKLTYTSKSRETQKIEDRIKVLEANIRELDDKSTSKKSKNLQNLEEETIRTEAQLQGGYLREMQNHIWKLEDNIREMETKSTSEQLQTSPTYETWKELNFKLLEMKITQLEENVFRNQSVMTMMMPMKDSLDEVKSSISKIKTKIKNINNKQSNAGTTQDQEMHSVRNLFDAFELTVRNLRDVAAEQRLTRVENRAMTEEQKTTSTPQVYMVNYPDSIPLRPLPLPPVANYSAALEQPRRPSAGGVVKAKVNKVNKKNKKLTKKKMKKEKKAESLTLPDPALPLSINGQTSSESLLVECERPFQPAFKEAVNQNDINGFPEEVQIPTQQKLQRKPKKQKTKKPVYDASVSSDEKEGSLLLPLSDDAATKFGQEVITQLQKEYMSEPPEEKFGSVTITDLEDSESIYDISDVTPMTLHFNEYQTSVEKCTSQTSCKSNFVDEVSKLSPRDTHVDTKGKNALPVRSETPILNEQRAFEMEHARSDSKDSNVDTRMKNNIPVCPDSPTFKEPMVFETEHENEAVFSPPYNEEDSLDDQKDVAMNIRSTPPSKPSVPSWFAEMKAVDDSAATEDSTVSSDLKVNSSPITPEADNSSPSPSECKETQNTKEVPSWFLDIKQPSHEERDNNFRDEAYESPKAKMRYLRESDSAAPPRLTGQPHTENEATEAIVPSRRSRQRSIPDETTPTKTTLQDVLGIQTVRQDQHEKQLGLSDKSIVTKVHLESVDDIGRKSTLQEAICVTSVDRPGRRGRRESQTVGSATSGSAMQDVLGIQTIQTEEQKQPELVLDKSTVKPATRRIRGDTNPKHTQKEENETTIEDVLKIDTKPKAKQNVLDVTKRREDATTSLNKMANAFLDSGSSLDWFNKSAEKNKNIFDRSDRQNSPVDSLDCLLNRQTKKKAKSPTLSKSSRIDESEELLFISDIRSPHHSRIAKESNSGKSVQSKSSQQETPVKTQEEIAFERNERIKKMRKEAEEELVARKDQELAAAIAECLGDESRAQKTNGKIEAHRPERKETTTPVVDVPANKAKAVITKAFKEVDKVKNKPKLQEEDNKEGDILERTTDDLITDIDMILKGPSKTDKKVPPKKEPPKKEESRSVPRPVSRIVDKECKNEDEFEKVITDILDSDSECDKSNEESEWDDSSVDDSDEALDDYISDILGSSTSDKKLPTLQGPKTSDKKLPSFGSYTPSCFTVKKESWPELPAKPAPPPTEQEHKLPEWLEMAVANRKEDDDHIPDIIGLSKHNVSKISDDYIPDVVGISTPRNVSKTSEDHTPDVVGVLTPRNVSKTSEDKSIEQTTKKQEDDKSVVQLATSSRDEQTRSLPRSISDVLACNMSDEKPTEKPAVKSTEEIQRERFEAQFKSGPIVVCNIDIDDDEVKSDTNGESKEPAENGESKDPAEPVELTEEEKYRLKMESTYALFCTSQTHSTEMEMAPRREKKKKGIKKAFKGFKKMFQSQSKLKRKDFEDGWKNHTFDPPIKAKETDQQIATVKTESTDAKDIADPNTPLQAIPKHVTSSTVFDDEVTPPMMMEKPIEMDLKPELETSHLTESPRQQTSSTPSFTAETKSAKKSKKSGFGKFGSLLKKSKKYK